MAAERRWTKNRRLPLITAGVLVSLVVASGSVTTEPADASPRPDPTPTTGSGPVPWWPDGAADPSPAAADPVAASDPPAPEPSVSGSQDPVPSATPSGTPSGTPTESPSPSGSPTQEPGANAPKYPAFGAYLDYGPRGVTRMAQLSQWLGGADLRVGHTYLPGDRWSNIEGADSFLDSWAEWRKERDDRLFVLNVPMLERNEEGVPDAEVRKLLQQGAQGDFDRHYRALAENLVDLDVPDTVVVLGWEMNGTTYTHRCGPDPESWKKYWKRIVTVMRSVPGQKFRFDFTPSRGRDAVPWTDCYPGDDVVDIVGMDSYDQPENKSFDEQVSEPYGLQAQVDFAAEHKKPISYPEWGLFRNGDNAEYMKRMLDWMDEHKPLYNTLTDYCPHGVWQCDKNPKASEVYRTALTGRDRPTDQPTEPTVPTEPTGPTEPTAPPECSPVNLGDWIEHWLGGKLCLRFDWWKPRS
ncbi:MULTISPECIES: glycosyl hydrolase [unclassified Streptomyces]|uniref:glycoside hydrolase family 26 protein n=1 Tax=unclassified Streptomyces TaxID=2593676 RepID=UPI000DC5A862|nr:MULTISPECIES: glycosyl hydrolase [unclassified Streptomyces]RAJ73854.1 glycosyl hydrolase family 26 [Streptomyces sp. PsTaAH-137]